MFCHAVRRHLPGAVLGCGLVSLLAVACRSVGSVPQLAIQEGQNINTPAHDSTACATTANRTPAGSPSPASAPGSAELGRRQSCRHLLQCHFQQLRVDGRGLVAGQPVQVQQHARAHQVGRVRVVQPVQRQRHLGVVDAGEGAGRLFFSLAELGRVGAVGFGQVRCLLCAVFLPETRIRPWKRSATPGS